MMCICYWWSDSDSWTDDLEAKSGLYAIVVNDNRHLNSDIRTGDTYGHWNLCISEPWKEKTACTL